MLFQCLSLKYADSASNLHGQMGFLFRHSSKDFTDKLIQQYRNNARIAKVNKYTGMATLPVGVFAALIVSFGDNKTMQDTLYSVGFVSVCLLVLIVPWCFWAHKRQQSFEAKHEHLKALYASS